MMRRAAWGAVLLLFVVASAVGATPRRMRSPPESKGQRTTRGFKNLELSVARGFGKRGEEGRDDALLRPGSRFPNQWLAGEVAGNPALALALVRRFVDEDGDGEVTAEEVLRPFAS